MTSLNKWTFLIFVCAMGCGESTKESDITDTNIRNKQEHFPYYCNELLTEVIVHDILSPPVASRVYAYSNLAFFEALRPSQTKYRSLIASLKGFDTLPLPDTTHIDLSLSAGMAFLYVAKALLFSKDSIAAAEKRMIAAHGTVSPKKQARSRKWAELVARTILKRAGNDQYKITRGMPRHSTFGEAGKWQQTPPEYADATEPHWRLIRPLLIDSASAFRPPAPPPYDLKKNSEFYKEMMEVYQKSKEITQREDTIAQFWDDNPFVTEHRGHLTFANKKITPVGHWMGIVGIVSGQSDKDELFCALAYALTAASVFDGFISCWEEKYHSNRVRPVTVIREHIESEWSPLLQTPPFPEYTSGHSVISASAGTVLEHLFGKDFAFNDTTEAAYLGMTRHFPSIMAAADEAGMSRLYGGIHFRSAISNGKIQGASIGKIYSALFDECTR